MTNEERQKLCADLRQVYRYIDNDEINDIIWRAADEIERLAALAQSDVERNIEKLEADGWRLPVNAAALDTGPSHADMEMARAKSYARGFQDGLKAARNIRPDPSPVLTQPEAEQIT